MIRRAQTLRRIATYAWAFHRDLWRRGKRVARALGTGPLNRLSLRILPIVLLWRRKFTGPGSRGLSVGFTTGEHHFRCRFSELCDFEILEEVFVDEVYGGHLPADASVVVDLGSHIGLSALYFASRCPSARVLAVEPNPELQRRLALNTSQLPGIEIEAVAVTGHNGEASLAVSGDSWAARLADTGGPGSTVPTTTLGNLLERRKIDAVDVLKIDIEGSEFEVLRPENLGKVAVITGELHPTEPDQLHALERALSPAFDVDIRPGGAPWSVIDARRRHPSQA